MIFQPGNLPAVGTGAHRSGPRGIGRAEKPMDHGSFCVAIPQAERPFLFAENALSEPCSGVCKPFYTNKKERNLS